MEVTYIVLDLLPIETSQKEGTVTERRFLVPAGLSLLASAFLGGGGGWGKEKVSHLAVLIYYSICA